MIMVNTVLNVGRSEFKIAVLGRLVDKRRKCGVDRKTITQLATAHANELIIWASSVASVLDSGGSLVLI